MFQDTGKSVDGISSFEEVYLWRKEFANGREIDRFGSPGQTQMKSPKDLSSSAFKVYDRVLERHRYIPRKWTQEEFEAALPGRFKDKTAASKPDCEAGLQKEMHVDGLYLSENETFAANEKINEASGVLNPQKKTELKEKIKNLKAIFEKASKSNGEFDMNSTNEMDSSEKIEMDKTQVEELERCKDSEAKVKLIEEAESNGNCAETSKRVNTSFLNAFLQCLFRAESFVQLLSNASENNPFIVKLKCLTQSMENPHQLDSDDVFLEILEEFSECQSRDEVLAIFLEKLTQETSSEGVSSLGSLIQGKFCHIATCESCASIANDFEPFLFLNPTAQVANSPNNRVLDVNFVCCSCEGIWSVTTRQFVIKAGMVVNDLMEELLGFPEFEGCDSVHIGEVDRGRLIQTFDKNVELSSISSTSDIFAFNVLSLSSEFAESSCNTAMPYHLYFNCGLCLSDGEDVGLFTHLKCGGMICRDCLNVITQSYHEWELCPCPICEQAIDLDKELCRAGTRRERREELKPSRLCEVMFRADTHVDGGAMLFGCPLMVSLPQRVTGHHLYRCIGYLLPSALPMKDRTSFTLHAVDKSGHGCSVCSLDSCHGCLVRIDDDVKITSDTSLVVHFDDLAEESKKNFGTWNFQGNPRSDSQGVFDGILQSCVLTSTSERMVCSKCSGACKISSSVSEFPHLLMIYLNHLYADQGLPLNTTVADVSRFLVLQHGDETTHTTKENLTYQITAVTLADDTGTVPSYKPFIQKTSNDIWLLQDESRAIEMNPSELQLKKNSVLFYEPIKIPDSPRTGHVLRIPPLRQLEDTRTTVTEPYRAGKSRMRLATISEEAGIGEDFKRAKPGMRPEIYDMQLEPGEYLVGREAMQQNMYSSQLSLGEIAHDVRLPSHLSADFDGISPISAQDVRGRRDSTLLRETKKLIRAVKQEDAYGIVCALKRGANPCLVINDVSALHLAAGIKSDQRCSMVSYLLKFAKDVNVATADGTTPLHVAAAWGHQDALELLLTHGGDAFDLTDQEGNTALDLASKDCSSFLQLFQQSDGNSPGSSEPSTSSRLVNKKAQRLEDIVRSNVTLPSFVHEEAHTSRSRLRRRWLKRFRSFRSKSSGVFRSLKRMSSIRRRSRIGVMVEENEKDENISEKL